MTFAFLAHFVLVDHEHDDYYNHDDDGKDCGVLKGNRCKIEEFKEDVQNRVEQPGNISLNSLKRFYT